MSEFLVVLLAWTGSLVEVPLAVPLGVWCVVSSGMLWLILRARTDRNDE